MLNNRLREARKKLGMSVTELARRTNTTRQTITNIELHGQEPSGSLMISIAKILDEDPRKIFFGDDVKHVVRNNSESETVDSA